MATESTSVPRKADSIFASSRSEHRSVLESEPDTDCLSSFSLNGDLPNEDHSLTYVVSPYHRLEDLTLSSDLQNFKFSSAYSALSSATPKNLISNHRQNVSHLPLNRSTDQPVPSTSKHGSSQSGINSSRSSIVNNAPLSNQQRLRTTPPVFHNVSDLAAHHDIPQFLPPAPRTVPRRTSSDSTMTPPEIEDFSFIRSEYLNMLSQNISDNMDTDENPVSTQPPENNDQEAVRAILDVILQAEDFLTSPMESPFDDFLATPGQRNEGYGSEFTSPLIVDNGGGDFASPLFHDVGLFEPPAPKRPPVIDSQPLSSNFDEMYQISPVTPALDYSTPYTLPTSSLSRLSNGPNGTRKHITPDSLIPLDAPVQPRKYISSSVTSRKEEPSRKRARSQTFGDEEDEQHQGTSAESSDPVAMKRLQNTLAARRSRKRKLEYQRELESSLDRERAEKEQWRARALTLEALLTSHGIQVPSALNF